MEFEEGGAVLRVLYATLGRKPTKVLVWLAALAIVVALSRWLIESVEWFAQKFDWVNFSWGNLLTVFVVTIMSTLLMVGFAVAIGIIIAVILRIAVDMSQRRRVENLAGSFTEILERSKKILSDEQNEQIDSLINETEEISKPPIIYRIMDKVFPKKKKHKTERK